MGTKQKNNLGIIGSTEIIKIENIDNVMAKIDTGADSSSVWVSNIQVSKDGVLSFCLFGEKNPLYTGETITRRDYKVAMIRNSYGAEQVRYRANLTIEINGQQLETTFTLSNRSNNNYPVLIGRHAISGRFLVDVSKNPPTKPKKRTNIEELRGIFKQDPYEFHRKYMEKRKEIK